MRMFVISGLLRASSFFNGVSALLMNAALELWRTRRKQVSDND